MIEKARETWHKIKKTASERPINPHGSRVSEIISLTIDAYTEKFHDDAFNKIFYLGRERVGRKAVSFQTGNDGKLHPYYIYFFDIPDPYNPRGRIGLKADNKSLTAYFTPSMGSYDQFQDDTLIDTGYLLDSIDQMCRNLQILGKLTLPEQLRPIT